MCRLLAVKSETPVECAPHLRALAHIAEHSREYQGHGWGCARLTETGQWDVYRNVRPIWEDDLDRFGRTTLLVAHARSAFRNEGIAVENNMPFCDESHVFAFNGELHGVRIRENGRIGAERLFNFIRRYDNDNPAAALEIATRLVAQRTRYIRAMNIVLADPRHLHVCTWFNEDAEYFTLHMRRDHGCVTVCSEPYPDDSDWTPLENKTVRTLA